MRPAPPRPGVIPRPKGPVPMPPVPKGPGRGGMTPPPGMMYGPNDALIPIPKKRGNTPVSSSGGKKDAVRMFSSSSSRSAGARGPKMVSRFKDGGCVMAGRGGKYKGEM